MQINIHVISFDQKSFCFNDVHLEDNHYGYCNEQTLVGFQIISLRSSEVKVEVLPVQITCICNTNSYAYYNVDVHIVFCVKFSIQF